jgi:predicted permease
MLRAEIWSPIRFTAGQLASRRSNNLLTFGRLAPGATVESAGAELRGIFVNLVAQYPQLRGDNLRVAPLHAESLSSVRKPLLLLFGAVCMVLLIAATNVAALLLARGVQRQREMAVRTALGASRWDTLRPVLLESFLLSFASALLGIALAAAGVKTIGLLAAARLPQLDGLRLDAGVLTFALGISVVVAILCGAAPGWRSASADPQDALRGGRGGGTGREHHRALRSLVVAEISLSLVLLIGAGLVLKGFAQLLANDPGFDASRLLTLRITTSALRYPNQTAVRGFVDPSIAAIQQVPGVEAAGAISAVPYLVWGNNTGIRYEGMPKEDPASLPIVEQRRVTPGFFEVTRQRLLAGRLLKASDDERPEAPAVVVVNQALVKRDFPNRDPIGQRYHLTDTTFAMIVGVVSDVRNSGPVLDPAPEMYSAYRQTVPGASTVSLLVRVTGGDPTAVMPGIRGAVRGVDPTAAIASVQTMDDVISRSLGRPRFYFSLLGTFAGIAILLAVAGLYGVLSYAVAQRTREIGIRAALGSSRNALVRLIAIEGFRLVATGVVIGLLGGFAVTRLMEFILYGVSPLDARTWVLAVALLVGAATVAAIVPARRAARVDPLIAMRAE